MTTINTISNNNEKHLNVCTSLVYKNIFSALAGVAQWTESLPANKKVAGLIPGQGTCLGCRPDP